MMTPDQAEELLLPLLVRAHAVRAWPQVGFVDQAAEYLVRKWQLDRPEWNERLTLPAQHQLALRRCKWIDKEVTAFLEVYPHAMGVELGGGLSTRFQRLSACADWPRFSWVDVDSRDVIDCADLIFPRTDNYRLVACDILQDDWLQHAGWTPERPLIVVVETLPDGASLQDLKHVLSPLVNMIKNKEVRLHLILDYASPALQKIRNRKRYRMYGKLCRGFTDAQDLLARLDFQGRVLNEQDLAADTHGPRMYRFLAKLYRRLTHKCFWGVAHLRLDAVKSSEQSAVAATPLQ